MRPVWCAAQGWGIRQFASGKEAALLPFPCVAAVLKSEKIPQEVSVLSVFLETANEVSDGTLEMVPLHDRCVHQQAASAVLDGGGLGIGHSFQHLKLDPIGRCGLQIFAKKQSVGDIEKVVARHADAHCFEILRRAGMRQHSFEIGVDFELGVIRSLLPVVQRRFHFFHGQICALHQSDFDAAATMGAAILCPYGEVFQCLEGIRKIRLQHDSRFELFEFGFAENLAESIHGQVQVPIFFHVQIRSIVRTRMAMGNGCTVESPQPGFDFFQSRHVADQVNLTEDRRDFYRYVVDRGIDKPFHDGIQSLSGLCFTQYGFAELVDVDPDPGLRPLAEICGQCCGLSGKDDVAGLASHLSRYLRHDDRRNKIRGHSRESQQGAIEHAKIRRNPQVLQ